MSRHIFYLLPFGRMINLVSLREKRTYSRWVSRVPVKVLSDSAKETHDNENEKLDIEKDVLKKSKRRLRHEESSRNNIKLDDSKLGVQKKFLSPTEVYERRSVPTLKQDIPSSLRNGETSDAFGLSSMIGEERDVPQTRDSVHYMETEKTEVTFSSCYNTKAQEDVHEIESEVLPASHKSCDSSSRSSDTREIAHKKSKNFVKLSDADSKLSKIMLLTKSKKLRQRGRLIALEGKRLIQDFINSGSIPTMVFFSRLKDINDISFPNNGVEFFKVTYKSLSLWSSVNTSPGVIAVFQMPDVLSDVQSEDTLPFTVICDNVRDPGNLGSILRVAAGAGCEKAILTKGCVDLWDSKVLRSAAGAHTRLPILNDVEWSDVVQKLPEDCITYVANSHSQPCTSSPMIPYNKAVFGTASHIALVVGGETHGLSSFAMTLASTHLHVPLCAGIDSLNAATAFAVIAFEIKRQLWANTKCDENDVVEVSTACI